ncbi:MAG TPA: hypothetical protein VKE27_01710 [Candidatus Dormibacteraeota bacterium]|nr:hypothetical protein [Candidatus Dormibacteraeota bacterium]
MTAETSAAGGVTHVTFGGAIKVDYIMVAQNGSLLVDDTQCSVRGMSTSLYVTPLPDCS